MVLPYSTCANSLPAWNGAETGSEPSGQLPTRRTAAPGRRRFDATHISADVPRGTFQRPITSLSKKSYYWRTNYGTSACPRTRSPGPCSIATAIELPAPPAGMGSHHDPTGMGTALPRSLFRTAAELKRLHRLSGVARKLKLLDNIA